ncbi:MAG TPA: tryptophan synthase subunit alpha [Pyrinomonadaceae bacterium]
MNRITETFGRLKAGGRGGLIPFITAGHPNISTTRRLLPALQNAGADVIELGVPFSDPIADGPVIQRSSQQALRNGVTLKEILSLVAEMRSELNVPIVLFSYINPVLQFGIEDFARAGADAGVDGVLLSDLPLEEAAEVRNRLSKNSIDLILLAAPTSSEQRLRMIAGNASGFIYAVSRTGVTGTRDELSHQAEDLVQRLRVLTSLPVAVGFGISTPNQVRQVCDYADAAVVGSAIVQEIEENLDRLDLVEHVERFVRSLSPANAQSNKREFTDVNRDEN